MITSILFDLDGTIINSKEGIFRCLLHCMKECGYQEPDEELMYQCIGPPLIDSFRNRLGVKEEDIEKTLFSYRERYDRLGQYECELYDGMKELVIELKNAGYHIYLTSSKVENACVEILKHFQIFEYFDDVVGSTVDGSIEQKGDVIQLCFRRNPNIKKEETILIGDTTYDVLGAREAGVPCIAVSYGFSTVEKLKEVQPACILSSVQEVRDYFVK